MLFCLCQRLKIFVVIIKSSAILLIEPAISASFISTKTVNYRANSGYKNKAITFCFVRHFPDNLWPATLKVMVEPHLLISSAVPAQRPTVYLLQVNLVLAAGPPYNARLPRSTYSAA